jgi:hypothetical protein
MAKLLPTPPPSWEMWFQFKQMACIAAFFEIVAFGIQPSFIDKYIRFKCGYVLFVSQVRRRYLFGQ